MAEPIKIIDVIRKSDPYVRHDHYYVVVDRMPSYVYSRGEQQRVSPYRTKQKLTAHDSGFYDFKQDCPGTTGAFAGRTFSIAIDDGTTLECHGQVWDSFDPECPEPIKQVGVSTIEALERCYVFSSSYISVAKLQAWLDENKPSRNYWKHDYRHTIEWLDKLYAEPSYADRPVCAARARKLKQRGVTIRKRGEVRTWSLGYERRKAEIERENALDAQP